MGENMFYLSLIQKQIISFILIVVFAFLIYFLIKVYKRIKKNTKKNNMLTLNLVIKYKVFLEYLKYRIEENESFTLYMVSIDNFSLIKRKYDEKIIKAYIRRVAKNLSICLPYGGKLAQTPQRETFIAYVPNLQITEESFGETLRTAALEAFIKNSEIIQKNISIGYVNGDNTDITKQLEKLYMALIASKRNLDVVTEYNDDLITSVSDYREITSKINQMKVVINLHEVEKTLNKEKTEVLVDVVLDNLEFSKYIKQVPIKDQSWINLFMIEMILNFYNEKEIRTRINLPVLTLALEKETFIDNLQVLMYINRFVPEQTTLLVKSSDITNEQVVIRNLLDLKNLGFNISYEIEGNISQGLYQVLQSYHVNRIEVKNDFINSIDSSKEELFYFAKVNHIDCLVRENSTQILEDSFITHTTKILERVVLLGDANDKKKKRGEK